MMKNSAVCGNITSLPLRFHLDTISMSYFNFKYQKKLKAYHYHALTYTSDHIYD